jgi:hypothetical protein
MKNFKKLCESILNEGKTYTLTIDGEKSKIIDTGMKTKYAFDGTEGANRKVQTYIVKNGNDKTEVDVFDNGKEKTMSYGSRFGFKRPNKMSDMDILLELLKQQNYADTVIKIK